MGKQEERSELLIVAQALESALQRFHALRAAQELNERIRPMLSGAEGANVAGAMIEIEAGGTDLAAKAQRLVAQASEQGFADVVRLAEALRQQLHAALNKLKLSAAKLARA